MMNEEYNAQSIRIMGEVEAANTFLFAKVEEFANKYPIVAPEAIERLLTAATMSGTPIESVEAYYLQNNYEYLVENFEELQEIYKELMQEATPGWK